MIQLKNLTLRRGAKIVLDDVTLALQPGEKAALVGRNGAGKSSLFALLTGTLHADAGEVLMPPTWRMAEVAQSMPETAQPATDFVLEGDTRLMAAQAALRQAEAAGDGHALAEAHTLLAEAGAFDAKARAQTLLMGLGFAIGQLDAPVNSFSGGWRMRLQLARALMCPADLLLLDEPTNHLDLDALVWLEGWLKRFDGTLLVISHDREFLDAVTRVTLHLDQAKLTRWGGNYSAFELMHAQAQSQQQAAYTRQQERIAQLTRFIDRFKAKATKARQAQSRVKALERMEKLAPVLAAREFAFSFQEPPALPNPMLVMRDVACGYMAPPVAGYGDTPPAGAGVPSLGRPSARDGMAPPVAGYGDTPPAGAGAASNGRAILTGITASVLPGQRIGILGANGQGKSTLVKTLAHELAPLAGTVTEGKGLAIGYFAQQEMDLLRPDEGALAHLIRLARQVSPTAREQELRDFLGGFAFGGDMAVQPIGTMSGGEKARLVLALLVWQRPNLLLLDEPTNHLDAESVDWLEQFLQRFPGTVVAITHDRYFLDNAAEWILELDRGHGIPWKGNYSDWLDQKEKRLEQESKAEDARLKAMKQELEWVRKNAKGRQAKSKARLARFEELSDVEYQKRNETNEIFIPVAERLGNEVIEFKNVSKSFGDRLLIDNLSFKVPAGAIVGIIGPNGAGKSTLFRLIQGVEQPDSGEVLIGKTAKLAFVDQSREGLDANKTVWEAVSGGLDNIVVGKFVMPSRAYIGRFNFKGNDQQKQVGSLSGGERGRLHLAKTLAQGGNVLMLDEPSNDLDVETLRALEEALLEFAGSAMVISHDRWFLDRICTHILAAEGDSQWFFYEGNYREYEEDKKKRLGEEAAKPKRVRFKALK